MMLTSKRKSTLMLSGQHHYGLMSIFVDNFAESWYLNHIHS